MVRGNQGGSRLHTLGSQFLVFVHKRHKPSQGRNSSWGAHANKICPTAQSLEPRTKSQERESPSCYNAAVFPRILVVIAVTSSLAFAQETNPPAQQPQVKVNMLNVCTPSPAEQQEIASALSRIPMHPAFSQDFEVDRGRSLLDPKANPLASNGGTVPAGATAAADFVRVRRDLDGTGTFSTVQYSFSRDREQMVETLVLRVRDPKDLLQISIEDSASSAASAAAMLGSSTPASRIRLERFGKSSIVLARCSAVEGPAPDQSAYEPLFRSATSILSAYRGALSAATLVPEELARISRTGGAAKPHPKSPVANKPK